MKKSLIYGLWNLLFCFMATYAQGQKGQNEFEKRRVETELDSAHSVALRDNLNGSDEDIITGIKTALAAPPTAVKGASNDISALANDITTTIENINTEAENAAVIVVFRTIKSDAKRNITVDFASLKTLIYHKKKSQKKNQEKNQEKNQFELSNYLLETKQFFFVFVDMSDKYYQDSGEENFDKKLSNTIIKIIYKKSFFRQSFEAAATVWPNFLGGGVQNTQTMKLTLIEVDPERIKAPCDIVGVQKTIKEELLTFPIHEKNFASFQFGIENTNYALNNFSISNGNLIVKPDTSQKKNWKSNLYSVIELHIPRDIDNFQPLWKDIFGKGRDRTVSQYLYDAIPARIGIYGGVKVAKDPLSNLYAGFNYAITKDLYINLGWTWTNEIIPQVTAIGNITSINDAKEYAKREYTSGKFSWGLSFAPSTIIDMFGLKSKGK